MIKLPIRQANLTAFLLGGIPPQWVDADDNPVTYLDLEEALNAQPAWIPIHSEDDLPKEEGNYLWCPRLRTDVMRQDISIEYFRPDDLGKWLIMERNKWAAWMQISPYQPQGQPEATSPR